VQLDRCENCNGRSFWHFIHPTLTVHFQVSHLSRYVALQLRIAKGLPPVMELEDGKAPLEVLVCRSCRAASFACPSLAGNIVRGDSRRCAGCNQPSAWPAELRDGDDKLEVHLVHDERTLYYCEGPYQLVVCERCKRADWYVAGLDSLKTRFPTLAPIEHRCGRCGAAHVWAHSRLRRHDDSFLKLLEPGFNAMVCTSCGHADLRSEREPPDAEILEVPPVSNSGPYR
jgi:hypothetical protein